MAYLQIPSNEQKCIYIYIYIYIYSHPKVDRICRFSKKNHHFHKQIDRIFGGKFMAPERSPKPTLQMVRFLLKLIENDQIPFDIE